MKADYIELDKLFPEDSSIEDKLQQFDDMCKRAEALNPLMMKAKVHYFHRVPNNGLFVRLNEHNDGAFKIYDHNLTDEKEATNEPLLELCRCKHCGEYVAVALQDTTTGVYEPFMADDSDMFDLNENDSEDSEMKFSILGLSNAENLPGDNNAKFIVQDHKLLPATAGSIPKGAWHVVGNTQYCCPYCNSKLTNKKSEEENDLLADIEEARLIKFRLSADFMSRVIAPTTLDQLDKIKDSSDKLILHDGQQYISFVDSRQAAAKTTLKQNLDQERLWFYTTIYHELCRRKSEIDKVKEEVKNLKLELISIDPTSPKFMEVVAKVNALNSQQNDFLTWKEISKILEEDKYCRTFAPLFANRNSDSNEIDEDGNITDFVIRQYVQSLMVMYLSKRPTSAIAPETMGLFHPCYTDIDAVDKFPAKVEAFNALMKYDDNKISVPDWRNLMQIFVDYTVRSNQSVFLKLADDDKIDIN